MSFYSGVFIGFAFGIGLVIAFARYINTLEIILNTREINLNAHEINLNTL